MKCCSTPTVALMVFLLVAGTAAASADEVPDPCKLLSESDLRTTLGIAGPLEIAPTPYAPPIDDFQLVDMGFGNLGIGIPGMLEPRENTLVCRGNAGDIGLSIKVTALKQAEADEKESRRILALLERRDGYKTKNAIYGAITCEEILAPASDMLGREAQPNDLRVTRVNCEANHSGWQIEIAAIPLQPKKDSPFTIGKLRSLAELAAHRLQLVPPTPEQNIVTGTGGIPGGFVK
jgi:hypothetical protein